MQDHAISIKVAIAGVGAFFSALWGYFGWMVVLWVLCMALDYLSGSIAAKRSGQWNSQAAREGLAGKGGMILFVLGAAVLDLLLGLILQYVPAVSLPFDYTMPVSALVLGWYILTEIGSLFENAEKLGAQFPPFIKELLSALKKHLLPKNPPNGDEDS